MQTAAHLTSHPLGFPGIQQWDTRRLEVAQARLMRARQQDHATGLPGIQEVRGASGDEDDAQRDWDLL